jgi:uncharacterized membrane protein
MPQARIRAALPVLLAALPFAYLVWMAATLSIDVPFWDQWELVPRLQHLAEGSFTFDDLWRQHNEHRPAFPILWMLTLARLSDWNVHLEIATNVTLGAGIFLIYVRYLRTAWNGRGSAPLWLLPVLSLLIFSPFQWENWLWGWQISALMGAFSMFLGLYLLATSDRSTLRFAAALACGVWSTYSFAAGLVYWVVGPIAIAFGAREERRVRAAVWAIVAGLTLASYFYHYHQPATPPISSNFTSAGAAVALIVYFLKYVGAPVAAYTSVLAALSGVGITVLFAALALRLRARWREPVILFPLLVGLLVLGVAAISATGRAWLGTNQALASRYGTISVHLWCASALLAVEWLRGEAVSARQSVFQLVAIAATVTILASAMYNGLQASRIAAARSDSIRIGRRGLITGRSDALLLRLYPDAATVRERRVILQTLRLSIFRR